MAIPSTDIKLLWGRAGGRCSNPSCRRDLTRFVNVSPGFHVGEMAHVIAQSPAGPRGEPSGGADAYDNLILLCPTCHTALDKRPDLYTEATIRKWKSDREKEVMQAGQSKIYEDVSVLKRAIGMMLIENGTVFQSVGPRSQIANLDPGSDAVSIWKARKIDVVFPNNKKIIDAIEANVGLISDEDFKAYALFKEHALAYEQQQYGRTEYYPLFPQIFGEKFKI